MRAKKFTFKKTKRVKTVTEHTGVCLDLTTEEAELLNRMMLWYKVTQKGISYSGGDVLAGEINELLTRELGVPAELEYFTPVTNVKPRKAKIGDKIYSPGGSYTVSDPHAIVSTPSCFFSKNVGVDKWYFADTGELVTQ
jgi:hypothetical protein